MFVPDLKYAGKNPAVLSLPAVNFVTTKGDSRNSLLVFSDLDNFVAFANDFPEAKSNGLLAVNNFEILRSVLVNITARMGVEYDARFDPLKSFAGHLASYETIFSRKFEELPEVDL
jgi:hypothetical protein